jgi:hypothetical protein
MQQASRGRVEAAAGYSGRRLYTGVPRSPKRWQLLTLVFYRSSGYPVVVVGGGDSADQAADGEQFARA